MVGRLVYERETPAVEEERREQRLSALAVGERLERSLQRALVHAQQPQLALELPVLRLRAHPAQHLRERPRPVRHRAGEVAVPHGADYASRIAVPAHEQAQQSGLAPPVAAHQTQAPAAVQRQVQALKHVFRTAGIGKSQIFYLDYRHMRTSEKEKMPQEGHLPATLTPPVPPIRAPRPVRTDITFLQWARQAHLLFICRKYCTSFHPFQP